MQAAAIVIEPLAQVIESAEIPQLNGGVDPAILELPVAVVHVRGPIAVRYASVVIEPLVLFWIPRRVYGEKEVGAAGAGI
jgi:hypothetical protein